MNSIFHWKVTTLNCSPSVVYISRNCHYAKLFHQRDCRSFCHAHTVYKTINQLQCLLIKTVTLLIHIFYKRKSIWPHLFNFCLLQLLYHSKVSYHPLLKWNSPLAEETLVLRLLSRKTKHTWTLLFTIFIVGMKSNFY